MNRKITILGLLVIAAQLTAKAQMTVGGSYKPSHTLVVKGQVKIDSVFAGSTSDNLLTIGVDSVLRRLPISSIVDGSQTRLTAGTNVTITGTGTTATPYVINAPITNALGGTANTLTSTVNGTASSTTLIRSIGNTSSANTLSTSINGITGTAVNIINSNALGVSGNTLTSTVNGVAATSPLIGSVSNTSTGNTISTSINGQAGTGVNIINTNTNGLSQAGGLVTSVNGISATTPIGLGTATNVLGFNSTGAPVYQTAASLVSGVLGSTTTNTLGVSGNILTSTVNGVAATAPLIGTVSNTSTANTLTTTINGQSGTAVNIINTNALTNTNGSLVSTVNGVASTPGVPVLGSASNGLTATNGNVALGGTLSAATTITGGTNKLSIASTATDGFAVAGTTLSVDGANQRVGIGTNAPAAKLDVRAATAGTALRMADGSQGVDKVLVSDASGNGSWTTIAGNTKVVWGTLSTASGTYPLSGNKYTGSSITLPPGKWIVNINMTLSTTNASSPNIVTGAGLWARATLSDVNTGTVGTASADIIGNSKQVSGGMTGPNDFGTLSGFLILSNTSSANKTYYFWQKAGVSYSPNLLSVVGVGLVVGASSSNSTTTTSLSNFGSTAWSEDEIVATPFNY